MVEFLQLVRCLKNLLMICWWLWWNDNSSSNKNTKTSTTTTIIKHYSSQAEETAEFWKSDNSNRTSTNRNSDCHDCVCVHACVRVCVWLLIPWKKCTFNQPPLFPQLCISCRVWVTEKRSSIVCWPNNDHTCLTPQLSVCVALPGLVSGIIDRFSTDLSPCHLNNNVIDNTASLLLEGYTNSCEKVFTTLDGSGRISGLKLNHDKHTVFV